MPLVVECDPSQRTFISAKGGVSVEGWSREISASWICTFGCPMAVATGSSSRHSDSSDATLFFMPRPEADAVGARPEQRS